MKSEANQTMYDYCQLFGLIFNRKPSSEEIDKIIKIANSKPNNHPLKQLSRNCFYEGGFELPLTKEHIIEFNNFNNFKPNSRNQNNQWLYYQIPNVNYQPSRQLRWNTSFGNHQLRVKDGLSWNRQEIQSFVDICYIVGLLVKPCYSKYYDGRTSDNDYEYYINKKTIDWEQINMINKYFTIRKIVINDFKQSIINNQLKYTCDQLSQIIRKNSILLTNISSSFSCEGGFSLPLTDEVKNTFKDFAKKYSDYYPHPYFDRNFRDYRFIMNHNNKNLELRIFSNLCWSIEEINEFIEILSNHGYDAYIDYSSRIQVYLF